MRCCGQGSACVWWKPEITVRAASFGMVAIGSRQLCVIASTRSPETFLDSLLAVTISGTQVTKHLESGRFKIIELNGAASEATNIKTRLSPNLFHGNGANGAHLAFPMPRPNSVEEPLSLWPCERVTPARGHDSGNFTAHTCQAIGHSALVCTAAMSKLCAIPS